MKCIIACVVAVIAVNLIPTHWLQILISLVVFAVLDITDVI